MNAVLNLYKLLGVILSLAKPQVFRKSQMHGFIKSPALTVILLVFVLVSSANAENVSGKTSWTVSSEQAKCFINNLPAYQEADSDPVVIFLKVCPVVDRKAALAKLQVATGVLPKVKIRSEIEDVIRYNHKELACLSNLEFDLVGPTIELPSNPCQD